MSKTERSLQFKSIELVGIEGLGGGDRHSPHGEPDLRPERERGPSGKAALAHPNL